MFEFQLIPFVADNEKEPFTDWILGLDRTTRKRILARLARIQAGNFGDCKSVDEGIFELRLFFDNGHRIYFGKDGKTLIILLCGGSKDTQNKDIEKAKKYWHQYNKRKKETSN